MNAFRKFLIKNLCMSCMHSKYNKEKLKHIVACIYSDYNQEKD